MVKNNFNMWKKMLKNQLKITVLKTLLKMLNQPLVDMSS